MEQFLCTHSGTSLVPKLHSPAFTAQCIKAGEWSLGTRLFRYCTQSAKDCINNSRYSIAILQYIDLSDFLCWNGADTPFT